MLPVVAERLRRHTLGNPLYLQMLLAEMPREHLARGDADLPVPASLAAVVRRQLEDMTAPARALVEAAAVLETRTPLALAARVAGVEDPSTALEPGVVAGLLRWWPAEPSTPIAMSHDLNRHAVLAATTPRWRRELHAAAASVVDTAQAWAHRVGAVDGPDGQLATELAHAAEEQLASANTDRAATLLLWAAAVCETRSERERHLLTAALRLMEVDRFARVQQILPDIESCAPSPVRGLVLGAYAASRGATQEAERQLEAALRAAEEQPVHDQVAAMAGVWLGRVHALRGRGEEMVRVTRRVLRTTPSREPMARQAAALLATGRSYLDGPVLALRELPPLPAAADADSADALLLSYRGFFRVHSLQLTAAIDDFVTARRLGHDSGRPVQDEVLYPSLSMAQYLRGDWDDAVITAQNGLAIAAAEDKIWALPIGHAMASLVPAARGEWDTSAALLHSAETWALRLDPHFSRPAIAVCHGVLAQAKGDFPRMLAALRFLHDVPGAGTATLTRLWWLPLQAEALIGTGHLDEAERVLAALRRDADETVCLPTIVAWLSGRLAEAGGDPKAAGLAFEHGLALPVTADDMPLYRGLLEHSYGRVLAVHTKPGQAATWLRQARRRFLALGAMPFLTRCENDLARTSPKGEWEQGGRGRLLEFTGRERDIAHLVGRGLTNNEIAAELFISVKTVEYHLSNVYSRFDFTGRRQLRDYVQKSAIQI